MDWAATVSCLLMAPLRPGLPEPAASSQDRDSEAKRTYRQGGSEGRHKFGSR